MQRLLQCVLIVTLLPFTKCFCQPADNKLSIRWAFKTLGPLYTSPIISGEIMYAGSCDSNLYSLYKNSGKLIWKLKTGGEIRSTACIYENDLYFLSGDGYCYCVDKNTGSLRWKFKTGGEKQYELFSFADYIQSSPVYNNSNLYFGSGDGNVYALSAKNGTLIWKFKTGSVVHSRPAIDSNYLYVGSFDGYFYALELISGKPAWKFKSVGQRYFPLGEMQGTPILVKNMVIVGSRDYNLYALNREKGYCEWNRKFNKGWAMGVPAFHDSILYVGTSDDKEMIALDPETGNVLWRTNVQFNIFGSPVFNGSKMYFGTLMGKLFSLDKKTGRINEFFEMPGYKENSKLYFNDEGEIKEGVFGTLIKRNEDFLSMYMKLGGIFSTPVLSDDIMIVTALDGVIYGLEF